MQSEQVLCCHTQQNTFISQERRASFDNKLHQRNQQQSYQDIIYAQRYLGGFCSIDLQPHCGFNFDSPPTTPRSVARRSSFDSTVTYRSPPISCHSTRDASPVMGCSASSPSIVGQLPLQPCRQLPCRYIYCHLL